MQVQIDIGFEQIVKVVKDLPPAQLKRLKVLIDQKNKPENSARLEKLLLSGPTATKKQLENLAKTRKAINQWRVI